MWRKKACFFIGKGEEVVNSSGISSNSSSVENSSDINDSHERVAQILQLEKCDKQEQEAELGQDKIQAIIFALTGISAAATSETSDETMMESIQQPTEEEMNQFLEYVEKARIFFFVFH